MTDTDYIDDPALLVNTPAQVESLLHSIEQVAGSIGHTTLWLHHLDINKIHTQECCMLS